VGLVVAVLRAPSRLATALVLDERFGLKERITTSLTLPAHLEASPAGQALLDDAAAHVGKLDVGSRFPLQVRWNAVLVPLGATAPPAPISANAGPADEDKKPIRKPEELAKKMEKLVKKPGEKTSGEKGEKSKELEKIEAELRDLVNKPRENREQLRERAK